MDCIETLNLLVLFFVSSYKVQKAQVIHELKINKYKKANDYAPLDYIYERIRELISNRKRIDYLIKIEKELIEDALIKKTYEKFN